VIKDPQPGMLLRYCHPYRNHNIFLLIRRRTSSDDVWFATFFNPYTHGTMLLGRIDFMLLDEVA